MRVSESMRTASSERGSEGWARRAGDRREGRQAGQATSEDVDSQRRARRRGKGGRTWLLGWLRGGGRGWVGAVEGEDVPGVELSMGGGACRAGAACDERRRRRRRRRPHRNPPDSWPAPQEQLAPAQLPRGSPRAGSQRSTRRSTSRVAQRSQRDDTSRVCRASNNPLQRGLFGTGSLAGRRPIPRAAGRLKQPASDQPAPVCKRAPRDPRPAPRRRQAVDAGLPLVGFDLQHGRR